MERRVDRTERGSMLVLALVIIVIVAVSGAAVLNQVNSATNVQTAYSNVRDRTMAIDAAADSFIQKIRFDPTAGDPNHSGTCSQNTTAPGTATATAWHPPTGTPGSNVSVDVWCSPDPGSAPPIGVTQQSPPSSIVALGGIGGLGNTTAAVNTDPNLHAIPFCDDYHDFNDPAASHPDRCECRRVHRLEGLQRHYERRWRRPLRRRQRLRQYRSPRSVELLDHRQQCQLEPRSRSGSFPVGERCDLGPAPVRHEHAYGFADLERCLRLDTADCWKSGHSGRLPDAPVFAESRR